MKIVADQDIPYIKTLFQSIGDVVLYDGREITPARLLDAEVLVVRTITRVNRKLLEGTSVKFVATATSGRDHIDTEYLHDNQIGFAHAPGCNARSVAEYVLSSLFVLAEQRGFDMTEKSVGIIGCGNAGSTVLALLEALDVGCRVYDPPLQEAGGRYPFHGLDDVLDADIITLHVPLISAGRYPTAKLVNTSFLSRLKPGVILINTSRGGVIDESALSVYIDSNPDASVVLDVWENEPAINAELLKKIDIGTAHIAGYSADAKILGAWSIYRQVCDFFNLNVNDAMLPVLPEKETSKISLRNDRSDLDNVQIAVLASYDVRSDGTALRRMLEISEDEWSSFFSELRNHYPVRREFPAMNVNIEMNSISLAHTLFELGFFVTATG